MRRIPLVHLHYLVTRQHDSAVDEELDVAGGVRVRLVSEEDVHASDVRWRGSSETVVAHDQSYRPSLDH
jgi:hypothetical protein